MRLLMNVIIPTKRFNEYVRKGTVGETLGRILEEINPESVYFTELKGNRAATLIVNVKDSSEIPRIAEPWFLHFDANVEFSIAMTPKELQGAGLDKIAKKWL